MFSLFEEKKIKFKKCTRAILDSDNKMPSCYEEDENDDCDFTWNALEEEAENGDSGDDEDLPDATRNTIRSLQNYYDCINSSLYF